MQDDMNQNVDEAADDEVDMGEGLEDGDAGLLDGQPKSASRGTLLIFAVVVLGAGGFFLMRQRSGPASASAAVNPESAAAKATIDQFLTDGSRNIRAMHDMLRNTEKVVQRFASFPERKQVPLQELKYDPFRLLQQAKVIDPEIERRKQAEQKANALAAVKRLKLQSIIYGERRSCMVNNELWSEGQSVEGVMIEKITPSSIIVESGGYRFEIKTAR